MISNRNWAGWLTRTAGALGFSGVSGMASYATALEKIPKPPNDPAFLDVCTWAIGFNDPAATIAAVFSGLGALASLYQLFGPKPYSAKQGAADREHQNDSFNAADQRQQGRHEEVTSLHDRTLAAVARDKHHQALADLEQGDPALMARYQQVLEALKAKGREATPSAIADAAITAETLSLSDDPAEQAIASLFAEGRFREAARERADLAERRLAKAGKPIAEELREAGRLALPFSPSEALEYFKRSTEIDPEDVWAWIELGRLRAQYGSLADSRACFGAALQRVHDERDRGVLHAEFGDVLIAEGQLQDARNEYLAAHSVMEQSLKLAPHDRDRQRDLSVSHNKLGNVAVAVGDLGEAKRQFAADLAIAERLAAADPGNAGWQRDLSVSLIKLGDVAVAAGDLSEAKRQFAAGLAIVKRLAAADPGNAGWQRDLSVSHTKLGNVAVAAGDQGEATRQFAAGLAIAERLAAADPGNAGWQRDLSVSHNKIGDVAVAVGDLGEAKRQFAADLAIAERLAAADHGNAGWQRDLYISNAKLAQLAEASGDAAGAIDAFGRAESIVAALCDAHPDHPGFARDLAQVRTDIARLEGAPN